MKTTTAFHALRNRHLNDSRAQYRFMVRSLNKDGSLSRMALTNSDWQMNAFRTEAEAQARIAELEGLNPGRRFAVAPL